ncbi:MAG TPA: alpha/beta hydrolase [Pseudonocardiaceae bacterium]|jgi:pimeloyl-ACP methyl ester carboxylesterase|nr:alpha/beta hydrolase [Pseudonocardiaceae bacterium]
MATFVLIPGAATGPDYWSPLVAALHDRGHGSVTPDLPCEDDSAGLAEYADTVVAAAAGHPDPVVVGHSLGGFTAPLVCDRLPVRQLVLLSAMIPAPGETVDQWWSTTGYRQARAELDAADGLDPDDPLALYCTGVDPEVARRQLARSRPQSGTPCGQPWPLAAWPDVPTRFLLCRDDRFFPAPFMRELVRTRLGIEPEEVPGGHLAVLSHAGEIADQLVSGLRD